MTSRIDSKKIPSVSVNAEDAKWLKGFKFSITYTFQSDGFHYYLQQFTKGDVTPSNRVLVTDNKNEVVYNELYYEMEGVTPMPLSFVNGKNNELSEWTGRLFKNKPPVLFGSEGLDFGCPWLRFLDKSGGGVNINCDNRH